MSRLIIETANEADLADLDRLENACFDEERRQSRRSLRRSLRSARQRVRVVRTAAGEPVAAAATLMLHPLTLRIYSLAVDPGQQGRGLGRALVEDAVALARAAGAVRVRLEVDARDAALVAWYTRQGFSTTARLEDYYGPGRPALRMRRRLEPDKGGGH